MIHHTLTVTTPPPQEVYILRSEHNPALRTALGAGVDSFLSTP